jgi:hypothetical protein
MKKIITLILLLANFIGNAQCPAPSNLTFTSVNGDALLSWTENGTATTWEIVGVPDFYVGDPLPSEGTYFTTSNIYTYVGLPPGCNVFFVRSVCTVTDVSPWVAIASSGCSTDINNYLATLSNNNFEFNTNNDALTIYPNPTKDLLNIETKNNSTISSASIYNALGQIVMTTTTSNTINVSNLITGIYFIKAKLDGKESIIKFIKE